MRRVGEGGSDGVQVKRQRIAMKEKKSENAPRWNVMREKAAGVMCH